MIVSSIKKMIFDSLYECFSLRKTPNGFAMSLKGTPEQEITIRDAGDGMFVVTSGLWSIQSVKKEEIGDVVAFFLTESRQRLSP